MNEQKWYHKVLIILLCILFSPLICVAAIIILLQIPKRKKEYKRSDYYSDLKRKYTHGILDSPEYRFYNSAIHRKLPIRYIKQESNGLEYFIYNETIFLFPNFDQMDLNEEGTEWKTDYDGTWKSFDEAYANLLSKLDNTNNLPVKLLIERAMFPQWILNPIRIPDCVFVSWNYENALENEDSPLKMIVPQNAKELYDMMCQTTDLCGKFALSDDNTKIEWDFCEHFKITLGVDPRDCYLGISKQLFGKAESSITHWHPSIFEIYNEVRTLGKRGNILVLRTSLHGTAVLYSGDKETCPYSPRKKHWFGKYYYLEAV